jgi:hypothetical protein
MRIVVGAKINLYHRERHIVRHCAAAWIAGGQGTFSAQPRVEAPAPARPAGRNGEPGRPSLCCHNARNRILSLPKNARTSEVFFLVTFSNEKWLQKVNAR